MLAQIMMGRPQHRNQCSCPSDDAHTRVALHVQCTVPWRAAKCARWRTGRPQALHNLQSHSRWWTVTPGLNVTRHSNKLALALKTTHACLPTKVTASGLSHSRWWTAHHTQQHTCLFDHTCMPRLPTKVNTSELLDTAQAVCHGHRWEHRDALSGRAEQGIQQAALNAASECVRMHMCGGHTAPQQNRCRKGSG
jgi:hypothetical protein